MTKLTESAIETFAQLVEPGSYKDIFYKNFIRSLKNKAFISKTYLLISLTSEDKSGAIP